MDDRTLTGLEGINRPWLYVGGLGSTFAAHHEDCCITGVNYMVDTSARHVDLAVYSVRRVSSCTCHCALLDVHAVADRVKTTTNGLCYVSYILNLTSAVTNLKAKVGR